MYVEAIMRGYGCKPTIVQHDARLEQQQHQDKENGNDERGFDRRLTRIVLYISESSHGSTTSIQENVDDGHGSHRLDVVGGDGKRMLHEQPIG